MPVYKKYSFRRVVGFTVNFTNLGDKPIGILKPFDGSFINRLYPLYNIALTNLRGEFIKRVPICGTFGGGLYSGTKFPDDYFVELQSKETFEIVIPIDNFFEVKQYRLYNLKFEYHMSLDDERRHYDFSFNKDKIWMGKVSGNLNLIRIDN